MQDKISVDPATVKDIYLVVSCYGNELGFVMAENEDQAYSIAGERWPDDTVCGNYLDKEFMYVYDADESEVAAAGCDLTRLTNDGYVNIEEGITVRNFTDSLIEDYSTENYYFVICMLDGELLSAGTIKAIDADEAICDYFDSVGAAYDDDWDDDSWDDLERYALKISKDDYDNNTYNLTDTASALAFIDAHEDEFEDFIE